MDEAGVAGAVAIQPRIYGYDHRYLVYAAYKLTGIVRIMPLVDPLRPSSPAEIARLRATTAVAGVRVIALGEAGGRRLLDDRATSLWHLLSQRGLPVGLLAAPSAFAAVSELVGEYPDLIVVIDHFGLIAADQWSTCGPYLLALAKHSNVHVKLSAIGDLSTCPPPHLDMKVAVDDLLEAYGPDRLIWGSDWPHIYEFETYQDSFQSLIQLVHRCKSLKELLSGTAARVFRFDRTE
jgi:predicted TIM-barrel fold metal-dependent hydrolase